MQRRSRASWKVARTLIEVLARARILPFPSHQFFVVATPRGVREIATRRKSNLVLHNRQTLTRSLVRLIHTHASHSTRIRSQAFDQHLNMVLGNVEETVTTVEVDEETLEEIVRVRRFRPRL